MNQNTNNRNPIIAASILSADIGSLREEILSVESAGADWLHIDIMDGSFVPPISFGASVVSLAKSTCKIPLDVHLMIMEPDKHLETFAKAGADRITIHVEATRHLHRVLTEIKSLGISNGVALNPGTPISVVEEILPVCDLILVMSVNPGWGGQTFIEPCLDKLQALAEEIGHSERGSKGHHTLLSVDGGIDASTAPRCLAAGAEVLAAGSYILGRKDRASAIKLLRGEARD